MIGQLLSACLVHVTCLTTAGFQLAEATRTAKNTEAATAALAVVVQRELPLAVKMWTQRYLQQKPRQVRALHKGVPEQPYGVHYAKYDRVLKSQSNGKTSGQVLQGQCLVWEKETPFATDRNTPKPTICQKRLGI